MFISAKLRASMVLILLSLLLSGVGLAQTVSPAQSRSRPALWRDPGDIRRLDLLYGPGSPERAPTEPFTFVKEDLDGESPKFEVIDANNVTWSVKLGREAQSETVSTRLVW